MDLPGVKTKKAGRYVGTTEEVLEILAADGFPTQWYTKHRHTLEEEAPTKCGFTTVYLLEGNWAYTLSWDGEKYLDYKKLPKPVSAPVYYCQVCKARMTKEEAQQHRNQTKG